MSGSNVYFDKKWKQQIITVSGNFVVPEGVTNVFVEMYGGGGAAPTLKAAVPGQTPRAYGGEAGDRTFGAVAVTGGASVAVVIGTGGVGGVVTGNINYGNSGTKSSFGSLDSPGGRGGASYNTSLNQGWQYGHGTGRDSPYASGGINVPFNLDGSYGGNAGYGDGGDAANPPGDGGIGAGGGANTGVGGAGGDGGDGIVIVYWKV